LHDDSQLALIDPFVDTQHTSPLSHSVALEQLAPVAVPPSPLVVVLPELEPAPVDPPLLDPPLLVPPPLLVLVPPSGKVPVALPPPLPLPFPVSPPSAA
jgi:hypothetical protein